MNMTLKTRRAIQSVILALLGLFLLSKIWTGAFFWYLSQRFWLLTLIAAIGFLVIPAVVWISQQTDQSYPKSTQLIRVAGHEDSHPQDQASLPLHRLVVVALPLILGVFIPARPLTASAVSNKALNTTASLTVGNTFKSVEVNTIAPTDRTILDWVRAFNYTSDPTVYEEQTADVVGFVYHDSRLSAGQFLVGRFAITHCVAEAIALGMIVQWRGDVPAEDTWVEVKGLVKISTLNGKPFPMIVAEFLQPVAQPSRPYLYP